MMMARVSGAAVLMCVVLAGLSVVPEAAASPAAQDRIDAATRVGEEEHRRTIEAMRPPKRSRPVVAVLANNTGAETTDFLVPYGILARSGVADVFAVAPQQAPVRLRPALQIQADLSLAGFSGRFPEGADYVIVPAMQPTPEMLAWVRAQAERGATVIGICAGSLVLSEAGLLDGRSATGYWLTRERLIQENPTMRWVPNRRYVADRGVVTTTGITASLPVSLALVEAIAGRKRAAAFAKELGATSWRADHDSAAFGAAERQIVEAARPTGPMRGRPVGIPVADGVDEIALAFAADAFSRVPGEMAVTVAEADKPVRTVSGLMLIPDRATGGGTPVSAMLGIPAGPPAAAMDGSLEVIRQRSGADTEKLVALQMEYPRAPKR